MDSIARWRGKSVLITGGTGFIGRHATSWGSTMGADIHTISTGEGTGIKSCHHRVDLTNRATVFDLLRSIRPDAVIHLAGAGVAHGPGSLESILQTNVMGTTNLLDAVQACGSPPVVMAGSGAEYAPQARPTVESDEIAPISAYGASKAAASVCARFYSRTMNIRLLRLFNVYGPGERVPRIAPYIIACAKSGVPADLTACEQVRDYAYVGDIAEALWRALASPMEGRLTNIFNVGTGNAMPLRAFVECLRDLLLVQGLEPTIRFGSLAYRDDEAMMYAPNVTRFKEAFHWLPTTPIQVGLQAMIDESI